MECNTDAAAAGRGRPVREAAAGRAPAIWSAGPESRRPPPGPEPECYIKYWPVRTRGRAIAQALPAWALPWLWTRLRGPTTRGAGAVCLAEGEGGREDHSRLGRCTTGLCSVGASWGSGPRGAGQVRDLQSSRRPWLPRVATRRSLRARRVLSVVGETLLLGQGALL